ncbi:MAG: hypothetical protein ACODAQ_04055 [Phycisphaeraceae bacterium]
MSEQKVWKMITVLVALAVGWPMAAPLHGQSDGEAPAPPEGEKVVVPAEELPEPSANLIRNGDFEQRAEEGEHPAHWQAIDNLVFFHEASDDPQRGHVMHIDTDVKQAQAYRWWVERFVHGAPLDEAPPKEPTQPPRYGTVAGLEGGFYWSDFIPVEQGAAYRVYVDAKGPTSKVFIRGYEEKVALSFGDEHAAVQEQFRKARGEPSVDEHGRPVRYYARYLYTTWFPVGGPEQWRTYTHREPRHPNNNPITKKVRYIRIMLYPYWPPGEYRYDNVRVVKVREEAARKEASD